MRTGTIINVSYRIGSDLQNPETLQIDVTPRSWSWDASDRSFAQGSPGDLDNCITSGTGLTADEHGCSASNPGVLINPGANQGFTISPATGPNAGLWFVTNPTTRMDLRTQVAKRYRTDGTTYPVNGVSQVVQACGAAYSPNPVPPQNNHGVNTTCFQVADFTNLVSFAWNHEGQHLSAAQQEAQHPANDLYGEWESIVATDSFTAFLEANDRQNDMHDRVSTQSASVDTGASSSFSIWYHTGSGYWHLSSVTVHH